MHRLVLNCFKSVAFAILFVIAWDLGFYLWKANVLNQRMESVGVAMQEVVSKNNYLTEGDVQLFASILNTIQADMNQGSTFVRAFDWNYNDNSQFDSATLRTKLSGTGGSGGNTLVRTMAYPAKYGDVMVIELRAIVCSAFWKQEDAATLGNAASTFKPGIRDILFTYTYLVPCLKYTTVTN